MNITLKDLLEAAAKSDTLSGETLDLLEKENVDFEQRGALEAAAIWIYLTAKIDEEDPYWGERPVRINSRLKDMVERMRKKNI